VKGRGVLSTKVCQSIISFRKFGVNKRMALKISVPRSFCVLILIFSFIFTLTNPKARAFPKVGLPCFPIVLEWRLRFALFCFGGFLTKRFLVTISLFRRCRRAITAAVPQPFL
jgi:hypothetical protein